MKLSIIMPVRNGEEYVLKALESIPDRKDIETIVVDDASEDGTYSVVKLYKFYSDKNIILLQNDHQKYCGGSFKFLVFEIVKEVCEAVYIGPAFSDNSVTVFKCNFYVKTGIVSVLHADGDSFV